jgi:hypothetical protein
MPHQNCGFCFRHFHRKRPLSLIRLGIASGLTTGFNDSFLFGSFDPRATYRTIPKNLAILMGRGSLTPSLSISSLRGL